MTLTKSRCFVIYFIPLQSNYKTTLKQQFLTWPQKWQLKLASHPFCFPYCTFSIKQRKGIEGNNKLFYHFKHQILETSLTAFQEMAPYYHKNQCSVHNTQHFQCRQFLTFFFLSKQILNSSDSSYFIVCLFTLFKKIKNYNSLWLFPCHLMPNYNLISNRHKNEVSIS